MKDWRIGGLEAFGLNSARRLWQRNGEMLDLYNGVYCGVYQVYCTKKDI